MPAIPYARASDWQKDDPRLTHAQAQMYVWRDVLTDLLRDVTDACLQVMPDETCTRIDQQILHIVDLVNKRL